MRRRTLAETWRVVKPGGKIVVCDYHRPRPWHPLRAPLSAAGLALLLLLPLLAQRHCFAADDVTVSVRAEGRAVRVRASATLRARYALIWETLTDYSNLADFIPGMKVSRLIERRGDVAVVEQEGVARLLAFSQTIKVVVESIERPPSEIGVRIVEGNLRQLAGQYHIEALAKQPGAFVLRWEGVIEPAMPAPGFISAPIMRGYIASQFLGMVKEIERRHALQGQALTLQP